MTIPRLFRNLAYATTALTFVLMIVGGVVRISDSGLGCGPAGSGTDGWPLCGGRLIPGVDTNMLVEYGHRALAGITTVLLVSLVVMSVLYFRSRPWILRVAGVALAMLLGQAVLGALTVEHGLTPALVAAHLGVAMLTLALLLVLSRLASQACNGGRSERLRAAAPLRIVSVLALAAVLATIVAGGYMASHDLRGSDPKQARSEALDAHMACGKQFPACNDAFLPFGESKAVDIHLTHRVFMYMSVLLIVALLVLVLRQRSRMEPESSRALTRWVTTVVGVLLLQVLLGALNVWLGEQEWLIVVHLTAGTLLWSALVMFCANAFGLQLPEPAAAKRRDRPAEAVPA
ncbi:MAG: COX15/CtaA family protein [Solirubrobacterales bacterium]